FYSHLYLTWFSSTPPLTLFPYTTLFRSPSRRDSRSPSRRRFPIPDRKRRFGRLAARSARKAHRADRAASLPKRRLRSGIGNLRRSEEHTSELQSRGHLVCRLLLEKKKTT